MGGRLHLCPSILLVRWLCGGQFWDKAASTKFDGCALNLWC